MKNWFQKILGIKPIAPLVPPPEAPKLSSEGLDMQWAQTRIEMLERDLLIINRRRQEELTQAREVLLADIKMLENTIHLLTKKLAVKELEEKLNNVVE